RTNTLNADPYHPPLLQGCPLAKHLQLQKCLVMGDDDEEDDTCPLCMQPMDETDISFFPCSCNYQVCLFCVHYIMEQMNGKCPACRQDYVESQFRYDASRAQSFREKRAEKKKGGSKKEEVPREDRRGVH
ncbi:MOT2, partial [Symbiodinium necroappetens]